jgi:hypothetical protein
MPSRTDRENGTPRWLVELAAGRLSDDELESLIPLVLAGGSSAPEEVIRTALTTPLHHPSLLCTA